MGQFSYFLLAASIPLPDELARTCACRWESDENKVVLEISEPDKKRTTDAQICSWRELFRDLEDEGHVEVTINSHELQRVSAGSDENRALSLLSFSCHVLLNIKSCLSDAVIQASLNRLCLLDETR